MSATLARRLAALEAHLATIRGTGCARCADLPAYPMVWLEGQDPPPSPWRREAPELARSGWPEDFRCPGCGREPVEVVTIGYDTAGVVWKRPPEGPLPAQPHAPAGVASQAPGKVPAGTHPAGPIPPVAEPEATPDPVTPAAPGAPALAGLLAAAQAALAPPLSREVPGVSHSAAAALPESLAERRRLAVEAAEEARRAVRWRPTPRGTSPRPGVPARYR